MKLCRSLRLGVNMKVQYHLFYGVFLNIFAASRRTIFCTSRFLRQHLGKQNRALFFFSSFYPKQGDNDPNTPMVTESEIEI